MSMPLTDALQAILIGQRRESETWVFPSARVHRQPVSTVTSRFPAGPPRGAGGSFVRSFSTSQHRGHSIYGEACRPRTRPNGFAG